MVKQKLKVNDVEIGDIMASIEFIKVISKSISTQTLFVKDLDTGLDFEIYGNELIGQSFSADRFFEERKVTRTEMAEVLSKSYNVPFTVVFQKAKGETRILRGRMVSVEALMGRARVIDLDLPDTENPTARQRLVDFRTLESLVVGGVKYTLKK